MYPEPKVQLAAGQNGGVDFRAIHSPEIYKMKRVPTKCVHFVG